MGVKFTRKGWYELRDQDGLLISRHTTAFEAAERIPDEGVYLIHQPDLEVQMPRLGVRALEPVARPVSSNGWAWTRTNEALDEESNPVPENRRYVDDYWRADEANDLIIGEWQVVPNELSTSESWSFSVNVAAQVITWYDDALSTPAWLTDNGWIDTGHDVNVGPNVLSGYVKYYGPGAVDIGPAGAGGAMYVVSVIPAHRPIQPIGIQIQDSGQIRLESAVYNVNQLSTVVVYAERYGGTDLTASAALNLGTGSTFAAAALSGFTWNPGEAGSKGITLSAVDVTGNQTVALSLGSYENASAGSQTTATLNVTDTDVPDESLAAEYTVSSLAALAAIGPQGGGGDTVVYLNSDTYSTQGALTILNSGISDAARLIIRPTGGDVRIQKGNGNYGIVMRGRQWVNIEYHNGNKIIVDGETTASKGSTSGQINNIADISAANNCVLEIKAERTEGWGGVSVKGDNMVVALEEDQHGNCYHVNETSLGQGNGQDYGDTIEALSSQFSANAHVLLEGITNDIGHKKSGHSFIGMRRGTSHMRHNGFDGSWATVSGYLSHEGNRCTFHSRTHHDYFIVDEIFRNSGKSADVRDRRNELMKTEGIRGTLINSFLFGGNYHGVKGESASWSNNCYGMRLGHLTFWTLRGPCVKFYDYGSGDTRMSDIKLKNIIAVNVATEPLNGAEDVAFWCYWNNPSQAWQEGFTLEGCIVPPDFEDKFVYVGGPYGGGGVMTLAQYESETGITTNSAENANLVNPNLSADFSTVYTAFAPQAGSPAINGGVHLGGVSGAGSNQRTLSFDSVATARWFPMDHIRAATLGPDAGGYRMGLSGVGNVAYDEIDYSGGRVIFSSPQTWSAGATVNRPISSGTVPNVGAVG